MLRDFRDAGYQLVLGKGGPMLKENPDSTKGRSMLNSSPIRGTAAPIRVLIGMLESVPDIGRRAVIDKTGLTGTCDFWLNFSRLCTMASKTFIGP